MVFNHVIIYYGYLINKMGFFNNDFPKIIEKKTSDTDFQKTDIQYYSNDILEYFGVSAYSNIEIVCDCHPCCSDISDEYMFLGKSIKSSVRIYRSKFLELELDDECIDKCENCENNGLCDNCISETIDGKYPINEIHNSIFKIAPEQ